MEFDIEKAKSGRYKIQTRDGSPVRIICWDHKGSKPIVAFVGKDEEFLLTYPIDGKRDNHYATVLDLIIID